MRTTGGDRRIARRKTEREDPRADSRETGERAGQGDRKKERGGRRQREKEERAATRPRLVIYTESYLHLNVFIFNARPRAMVSPHSGGFVSASHLCAPSPTSRRAPVPLRFSTSERILPSRSLAEKRRRARTHSRTQSADASDASLRCFPGGLYSLISPCVPFLSFFHRKDARWMPASRHA